MRSGSLEHCVNKNRWSSYVAPRVARFDDQEHANAEPLAKSQPEGNTSEKVDKQPSLLEVFEAELAKETPNVQDTTNDVQFPDPEISAIPPLTANVTSSVNNSNQTPTTPDNATSTQQPNILLDGFKMISDHLNGLALGHENNQQDLSQIVEHGIRTAAEGFDSLIQGLTGGVQEFSDRAQQAADRLDEIDDQGIDDAIKGFREFVGNLTAGINAPGTNAKQDTNTAPSMSYTGTSHAKPPEGNLTEGLTDKTLHPPEIPSKVRPSNPKPGAAEADPHATAKDNIQGDDRQSESQTLSDITSYEVEQPERCSSSDGRATLSEPRYHQPGPIHLKHHVALSRQGSIAAPHGPSAGLGYVNHLRRCQSIDYVDESVRDRTMSPPPAATRFPTLAQFEEGQNFATNPSFPALPSMEPLVPQRATSLFEADAVNAPSQPAAVAAPSSQKKPVQNTLDPATTANHVLLMNNGVDYTEQEPFLTHGLSDDQIRKKLLEQQSKKRRMVQQEAESFYPQGKAKENALHDWQMQLKLLDQQNKKRLLMARQEQDAASKDPQLPGAFPSEETHKVESTSAVPAEARKPAWDRSAHRNDNDLPQEARSSSAARLAEPFDPLEVEPSAQPHLTEGVRRHATVAGTYSGYNTPRRRLYQNIYGEAARVGLDSFTGGTRREDNDPWRRPGMYQPRTLGQARNTRNSDQHHRYQEPLRRSATVNHPTHNSPPSFRRYDDEHQDDSTVGAINHCVEMLMDLGYGDYDEAGSGDRLLVYAQAAGGDLVEAIDLIDEEQRVYREFL